MKNKGLGRGLDAVFDDNSAGEPSGGSVLRISDIEPRRDQPRKHFDEQALSELAASIARNGLIQPVVVRDTHNGFYSIVAGERRWRAAKMSGLTEIPVVIIDVDDARASELAIVENIQRENLNPVEEALAYRSLMEDFKLTQEETAARVGKSRSAVANFMRLLELPPDILDMLAAGKLSAGHARALLGLTDRSRLAVAAHTVVSRGLSVRETENLVRGLNRPAKPEPSEPANTGVRVDYRRELEVAMTRKLGRRVCIKESPKKKRLELEYSDNDDLQKLVTALCGKDIMDS